MSGWVQAYYVDAPDKDAASEFLAKQIAKEHTDLIETGGDYLLIVEEDDGGVSGKNLLIASHLTLDAHLNAR